MKFRYSILAVCGLAFVSFCSTSEAGLIVSLDTPNVSGTTASIDVRFEFTGDPADTIEAFQLSVIGSDSALTAGGTDYSRFTFNLNADPLLDNSDLLASWSGMPSIADGGFEFFLPADALNGPFLTPNAVSYLIGTLSINLSGLSSGSYLVTLGGNDPLFPTLALGTTGGNFDEIGLAHDPAGGVSFQVSPVPEPASATLLILGAIATAGIRWRSSRKQRSVTVG